MLIFFLNMKNVEILSTTRYFVNSNMWRETFRCLASKEKTKYLCQKFDAVTFVLVSGFAPLHIVRNFVHDHDAI